MRSPRLKASQQVPEAEVGSWDDIERLDVRPAKGMVKVRCKNQWEVQLDAKTGEILQVAYRRSDVIESIHDGSFFHDNVKLWVFLPAGLILAVLWATGIYLFLLPHLVKWRKGRERKYATRVEEARERRPLSTGNPSRRYQHLSTKTERLQRH